MTLMLGAILAFVLIGLRTRRPRRPSYLAIAMTAAALTSIYAIAPWLM